MHNDLNTSILKNESYNYGFSKIIDTIAIGFFRTDSKGLIIEINKHFQDLLSIKTKPQEQYSFFNFFKEQTEAIQFRQILVLDKQVKGFEATFTDTLNNSIYVCINAVCIDSDGSIEGTLEDNREKVKTLRALRISEDKYRSFLNQVPLGIYRTTINGDILFANQFLANLLEYNSIDDIKGKQFNQFLSGQESYASFLKELNRKKETSYSLERVMVGKNGHHIWVYDTATAFYDTNNELLFIDGTLLDISKRKNAENEWKKAENKFYQLADLMPETIFDIDLDGNINYISKESYNKFGYQYHEKLPNAFEMFAKADKKKLIDNINKILIDGTTTGNEYTAIRKDGSIFPVMMYALPVVENNITKGFRGIITDISDIKKTEQALRESEEKYRTLIELSNDAIVIHRDGKVLFANKRAYDFLGYNYLEDISNLFDTAIAPQERNKVQAFHNGRLKGIRVPELYETILLDKGGNPVYVEANNTIVTFEQSDAIMSVLRNITSRIEAERKLHMLGTAINQITEAVVITNPQGIVEYVNPAFEKISQYSQAEVSGKPISIIKSSKHDSDFYTNLWNTIVAGKNWSGIIVNKRKSGELYEEFMEITPIKAPGGNIINYIAIKRDKTDDRKLEKQLRESQKLQAIGTLAGGIAHDFNNILMGMQLFTDITLKRLNNESIEFKSLLKVKEGEDRAKDLIRQILTFSRQTGDEREEILIHSIVKEALKMIRSTFPASILWEIDVKDCGNIMGNPTHIHQIIMNLCTNASHAMEGQGTLSVTLEKVNSLPENNSIKKTELVKEWVRLVVKDTGCGIAHEIRDRIFEPFFTTKAVGHGTGLGLATVHGIVKQYEGEIFFVSKVNKGTAFYIYLPTFNK